MNCKYSNHFSNLFTIIKSYNRLVCFSIKINTEITRDRFSQTKQQQIETTSKLTKSKVHQLFLNDDKCTNKKYDDLINETNIQLLILNIVLIEKIMIIA